ncbi:MAG: LacI family DNA-binding transcriptional regulator [Maricaulaceae bacterium]|jgi:LacI family transcriptional regulator
MLITLNQVAARAGVSVATASRALAGGKVTQKNLDKVLKAAEELGYVANHAARGLRSDRSMAVGVMFNQIANPLALELLEALSIGFEERGYSVYVSTARGREDLYDLLVQRFLQRRVDALLCINPIGEGDALARFEKAGIPVAALFSSTSGYDRLPLYAPTMSAAATEAARRLKALGHERVAVIRPRVRATTVETFRRAGRELGLDIVSIESGEEAGFDAVSCLASLFSAPGAAPPTAIVARQAEASPLLKAADEMHVLVPNDLSIISIRDRSAQPTADRIPFSTIHLDPGRVGFVAVNALAAHLDGAPLDQPVPVEIGSWIERRTTGPACPASITALA